MYLFRERHSTVTAATLVWSDIVTALDRKKHFAALFIDLSKSFDSVVHALLFKRLCSPRFDNMVFKWFQSNPGDTQQWVYTGNVQSEFVQFVKGVPQIYKYINEITSTVLGCDIHLNADDTILYCTVNDVHFTVNSLQHCFSALQVALKNHQLVQMQTKLNSRCSPDPKILIMTISSTRPTVVQILKK